MIRLLPRTKECCHLRLFALLLSVMSIVLTGCVSTMRPSSETVIISDGAPDVDVDVSELPDAVPKEELIKDAGNKTPYTVLGETYHVNFKTTGFTQTGFASWYGKKFHGNKTSNGEIYDMYAMSAAHKTLPIPSYVRVENLENGKSVIVRVNDRGPFHKGRIIDLSYAAAKKLDYHNKGTTKVRIDVVEQVSPAALGAADAKAAAAVPQKSPQTYLQVGAFRQEQSAANLRSRLSPTVGPKVLVRPEPNQSLFKVVIGPILDNLELATLRQKLVEAKFPNAHLVEF